MDEVNPKIDKALKELEMSLYKKEVGLSTSHGKKINT